MSTPSYKTCPHVGPACPVEATTYGYYPNLGANIFLTVWFGVLALAQLGYGLYSSTWTFMVAMVMACSLEAVGYIGRVLMSDNPWNKDAFQVQIVCIILGPTFVAAGIYLTLKHLVLYIGPEYSRIKPWLYTWIFIGCDIGSLLLQAAGGGLAASAGDEDKALLDAGNNVIITGIAFQVVTMATCGLVALEYFIRVYKHRRKSGTTTTTTRRSSSGEKEEEDGSSASIFNRGGGDRRSFYAFCGAEFFAYITVLIRCIYRIPEMAGGWGNHLMRIEKEFLVLDGMMIALGCFALTVFHPGHWFHPMRKRGKTSSTPAQAASDSAVELNDRDNSNSEENTAVQK